MSAVPAMTSAVPAVTMQDLELEHAELLPARETLNACRHPGGSSSSFTQVGYGNTAQAGLLNVAVANGSFNNILSLGSGKSASTCLARNSCLLCGLS